MNRRSILRILGITAAVWGVGASAHAQTAKPYDGHKELRNTMLSAAIAPLPSCVSTDNPSHYQPAVYRDLIMEFFRANYFHQQGHKSDAAQTAAVMP